MTSYPVHVVFPGRLVFVDIAAPGFDPAPYGATRAEMDASIHAVRPDGSLLRGVEVLRLAYAAVGLGWVFAPIRWKPLRPLAELAYRGFARHRRRLSRWAAPLIDGVRAVRARRVAERMAACSDGGCDLPRRTP